jgi:hypothetical protein
MERVASHALLRTLVQQMEGVVPEVVSRSRLPSTVLVRALQDPDNTWVLLPNGKAVVAN